MTRTSFLKINGKGSASNPAKINSAWAVFKDTVIRCRNPFILYLVAMIIFGPVGFLMEYSDLPRRLAMTEIHSVSASISLPSLALLGLVTAVGASIVIPMVVFSYLDNRRAMDTFHALPVTRGKMFLGNICAGLFLLFVPFLVTMPLTAGLTDYFDAQCGAKWNQTSVAENFDGEYLKVILAVAVSALLCYMLMSFLMFCCSTVLESAGYFAIIMLGYAALLAMGFDRINRATFGFSSDGVWFYDFLKRFSPVYYLLSGTYYHQFWLYQLQITLLAVVFGLLAWRRAVARKSEQAGGFVWLPVYYIAAIGGSLAVGMGSARILSYALDGMTIVVAVLLGVLAYVILDTIRNRGFKNIARSLIVSALSVAGVAVFSLLVVVTGTFGYESWLPVEDNIESVVVYDDNLDGFSLSDAENIHRVVSFHQAVLANQKVVEEGLNQPLVDYLPFEFDENQFAYAYGSESVNIQYTMKNGRVITRQYSNVPRTLTRYLYEVAGSVEYTCSIADQLQAASETLPMTAYEYGTEGNWRYEFQLSDRLGICQNSSSTMPLTEQDAKAFIAALAEDFRRRPEGWKVNPETQPVGQVSFHVLKDYTVAGAIPVTNYELYIYECDLNTLDLLEQFGYYSADTGVMYNGDPFAETVEMTFGIVTPEEYPNPAEYAEGDISHFSGSIIGYYSEYDEEYYYADEPVTYDDKLAASNQPTAAAQELTADSNAGELTQVRLNNDAMIDVVRRNFTTEDMNALFDLIKYVGYSDEPLPIVMIDHQTYLIPEENVEAVRELIFG